MAAPMSIAQVAMPQTSSYRAFSPVHIPASLPQPFVGRPMVAGSVCWRIQATPILVQSWSPALLAWPCLGAPVKQKGVVRIVPGIQIGSIQVPQPPHVCISDRSAMMQHRMMRVPNEPFVRAARLNLPAHLKRTPSVSGLICHPISKLLECESDASTCSGRSSSDASSDSEASFHEEVVASKARSHEEADDVKEGRPRNFRDQRSCLRRKQSAGAHCRLGAKQQKRVVSWQSRAIMGKN
eukprot:TRINITY_DN19141_c0_g1_i3.p1 TRINITY_DN19141_c0_g1~~TRINITY_DN19141_c0_g1_i3.p1  ORF type:complete len:259 (-),score=35.69 TRINITY_DN19141_c0_g1_i3:58-774(-)